MTIAGRRERERILQVDYIKRNWYLSCSFPRKRLLIERKFVENYLHHIASVDHDAGVEQKKLTFVKILVRG